MPFLFVILAGIFDAICDAWRDGKDPLIFLKVKYTRWYQGSRGSPDGISPFKNNGTPWQSDFWHLSKLLREYCWCLAISSGLALISDDPIWWLSMPVFAFVKGFSFTFFYHQVFKA